MGRHRRNKPGQGAYLYKERKLYFETCECGRRFQTFYKRNLRIKKCGICRRAEAKISPGQESMFDDPPEATMLPAGTKLQMEAHESQIGVVAKLIKKETAKGEKLVISMSRQPGKNTLNALVQKHNKAILEASAIPARSKKSTKGGDKRA